MSFFQQIKAVKKALSEAKQMQKLTAEELLSLDNKTLFKTLDIRLAWETRWIKSKDNYTEVYNGAKRVFYVITQYCDEVNNGGLCQYFSNPSRLTAPYLLESLTEIGADKYATLLSDFLVANNIDVSDLSSFVIKELSEFQEQNKRYPFDAYDKTFYELYKAEPLENYLLLYVRQHIKEFEQ